MKSALIGYTGFIGTNLACQTIFTDCYNSENIHKIKNKKYDLVVSAATKAERWKANQNPRGDWNAIKKLLGNLRTVKAKHFVAISTVDVYPNPNEVTEDTPIKQNEIKQAYGRNRFRMEQAIKNIFPRVTILRLPQTFGKGLKKNFVYDLIHDNALDFTHKDSSLQFYNLDNLWRDIQKAVKNKYPILNLAVEPITAKELAKETIGLDFKTVTQSPPFAYNMTTKYGRYLYSKEQVLQELKVFILKEKAKTKIAISNLAWEKEEDNKILSILKRHQVAGIEVAPAKIWANPAKVTQKEAGKYKSFWNQNGIQIVATTSLLFGHPELTIFKTKKIREKTLGYLGKMISLSSWLGAKIMVFGSPKNRLIGDLNREEADKIAIDFFQNVGQLVQSYDILFCLEPIPSIYGADYLNNSLNVLKLVKKINHPNIKMNLDTGAMKINRENLERVITKVMPHVGHFHISNKGFGAISNDDTQHRKISQLLKKLRYQNWASIEMWATEKTDNCISVEKTLKFIKETYE